MLTMGKTAVMLPLLTLLAGGSSVTVVGVPDSPVRLDRPSILTAEGAPPVLLYAATNLTKETLEQFTITVFVFDPAGTLKSRQTAPGRRTLEPGATKYTAMVL